MDNLINEDADIENVRQEALALGQSITPLAAAFLVLGMMGSKSFSIFDALVENDVASHANGSWELNFGYALDSMRKRVD